MKTGSRKLSPACFSIYLVCMSVVCMLGLGDIIHPAGRALTRLIAATAFAVHRANVGRGIFFPFTMRFCFSGFGLSAVVVVLRVVVIVVMAAACEDAQRQGDHGQKQEFLHG